MIISVILNGGCNPCNSGILQYIHVAPIHSLDNLITAVEKGSRHMTAEDHSSSANLHLASAALSSINFAGSRFQSNTHIEYSLSSSLPRLASVQEFRFGTKSFPIKTLEKLLASNNRREKLQYHGGWVTTTCPGRGKNEAICPVKPTRSLNVLLTKRPTQPRMCPLEGLPFSKHAAKPCPCAAAVQRRKGN